MLLIPAIDLKDGRCVRLYQGDFAALTTYAHNPLDIFERYRGFGARRIHVVDLDGAKDGTQRNLSLIREMAARQTTTLQVGGGLRSLERVQSMLAAGAQFAVVGSIAVNDPDQVIAWSKSVGPERLILGFDVRLDAHGAPCVSTHGWQNQSAMSLWDLVERYIVHGFRDVLCTDIARDGALTGPNQALYGEAQRRFPEIRWQASGGIASVTDLTKLNECGVAAAISGRALLENKISDEELQPFLRNASFPA